MGIGSGGRGGDIDCRHSDDVGADRPTNRWNPQRVESGYSILVRSTASGELVRYFSSQTTMYVDETGAPLISIDSLKAGIPVTVQYIKVADQLVASRVSLGHASTVGPTEKTKAPIATAK